MTGGYDTESLVWMINEAEKAGLKFDYKSLEAGTNSYQLTRHPGPPPELPDSPEGGGHAQPAHDSRQQMSHPEGASPEGESELDKKGKIDLRTVEGENVSSSGPTSVGSAESRSATTSRDVGPIPETNPGMAKSISSTMSAVEIVALFDSQYCPDISQDLDLQNCGSIAISGGGFGDVYLGKLRNGDQVAIKCARLFLDQTEQSRGVLKDAARELYAWSKCQHVYVIELLGVAHFHNQLAMVSRWSTNGTLPQYVSRNPKVDRLCLCHQVATALDYLHRIDLVRTLPGDVIWANKCLAPPQVHGDIKGSQANVLISDEGYAQLTDFGSSILKHSTMQFTGASFKPSFSLRWATPELIEETVKNSKEADIYALGMVQGAVATPAWSLMIAAQEAFTGDIPYAGRSETSVMYMVMVKKETPSQPSGISPELWDLLTECWKAEPAARPTAYGVFIRTHMIVMRDRDVGKVNFSGSPYA
ncbi:hypothetical protein FRC10_008541 [Ceratobasidium sp. 414]|nr:hypothetical protein FRC10_008541 [Ceratobasidium sp. 414]